MSLESRLEELIVSIGADVKTLLSAKGIMSPGEPITVLGNTGTAKTVDVSTATFQTLTLNGNCTFTLSGSVTGKAYVVTLMITFDTTAGRTMTWPAAVKWLSGAAPSASVASKVLIVTLLTVNGGTSWYGSWTGPA